MQTQGKGETKISSNGLGHMTKMTAMPIYGKTFKYLFQNQWADTLETYYVASGI